MEKTTNTPINNDRVHQLLIEMVMRQTTLTFDEAKAQLEIHNNNYIIVIKQSLGIKPKVETELKTVNQQIYTEIRGLMDLASDTHRKKKRDGSRDNKSVALTVRIFYPRKLFIYNIILGLLSALFLE